MQSLCQKMKTKTNERCEKITEKMLYYCSAYKEGVAVKCKIYDWRQTFVVILWSWKHKRKGKQLNE